VRLPTSGRHCFSEGIAALEVAEFIHAQVPGCRLVIRNVTGHAVAAFVAGHP
jgi:hypothetical protein